ncbi:hypothetical protein EW146_g473 [Bondarzewia mesenterica]|uniref:Autophagy-related protein 14 n=1 Tax=Bondarzewia mesenterica TaxID=1095465 RepID=A0A4S4M8B3_9AGAM|nr:hypothetical protein EW146_g473 [Bondarzewia mesenterica]
MPVLEQETFGGSGPSEAVPVETWEMQHLLRHITCVQVKNFTPFPARDALASALSQPSEHSQYTAFGNLSDDLDVARARKRSRRISSTSIATAGSPKFDTLGSADDTRVPVQEYRGRKRTMSRASGMRGSTVGASPSSEHKRRPPPISGSGPTIRPSRPRTSSMVSHSSLNTTSGASPLSLGLWPDHSQAALEKALQSRLVETFITMTVHPPASDSESLAGSSQSFTPRSLASTPPRSAPSSREKFPVRHQFSSSTATNLSSPSNHGTPSTPESSKHLSTAQRRASVSAHRKVASISSHAAVAASTLPGFSSAKATQLDVHAHNRAAAPIPNYISPIHRPSTNPSFIVDPRSSYDYANWTDLTAEIITIQLWGKVPLSSDYGHGKGKGKEKATNGIHNGSSSQWKMMEEWTVDLTHLVSLPDEFASHPSHLPSNSLLVTLSTTGRTYYLPRPSRTSSTRPPSPDAGYSSDPEGRGAGEYTSKLSDLLAKAPNSHSKSSTFDDRSSWSRKGHRRSAGWQDVVKLLTLQTVILDTQRSLAKLEHDVEKLVVEDELIRMKREISEREARVDDWQSNAHAVRDTSEILSSCIRDRGDALRKRRRMLAQARLLLQEDVFAEAKREEELIQERSRILTLHKSLAPIRVNLIATLASIFPIDLLSGPDLLYTILDVPLPIPTGTTDPAPPLSFPSHKEVTEDGIATALGYAAHVVHLLATYMEQDLVYPITCVGSKSLIRDGISAMVGPRMFPLFSKGVDTYRFEYGVFLLNKDIELLMSESNLRALDMRHTLPNVKNLLLTLTADCDSEGVTVVRTLQSPAFSVSGLVSPPRPSSPTDPTSEVTIINGTLESTPAEVLTSDDTPPHSGASTPKSTSDAYYNSLSRMSKPFFGLSGFLRSRHPSSSQQPSVKPVPEVPEGESEGRTASSAIQEEDTLESPNSDGADDDGEEDRRTIRGVVVSGGAEDKPKKTGNGQLPHTPTDDAEKTVEGEEVSTRLPQIVTHMS